MSCEYCKSGERHAKDIIKHRNTDYCEPITCCIWNDGIMHIETEVDNLYASIEIIHCPMCGAKLIESEKAISNIPSHSEKDIVNGCISLMQGLYQKMIEYMEHMDFEYDKEIEEERPEFGYSYFKIVQKLLLQRTSHSGGNSTRKKCKQLGFDSSDIVEFSESEDE